MTIVIDEQNAEVAATARAIEEVGLGVISAVDQHDRVRGLSRLHATTTRLLDLLCESRGIVYDGRPQCFDVLAQYMGTPRDNGSLHPRPGEMLGLMGDAVAALDRESHVADDEEHMTKEQAEEVARRVMSLADFLSAPDRWLMRYEQAHDAVRTALMLADDTIVSDGAANGSALIEASKTGNRGRWYELCAVIGLPFTIVVGFLLGGTVYRGLQPSCSADSDCESNFCDRGKCTTPVGEGAGYGDTCINECSHGLSCVQGRCRSCVDDDECGTGTRCSLAEWSGQRVCTDGSSSSGLM